MKLLHIDSIPNTPIKRRRKRYIKININQNQWRLTDTRIAKILIDMRNKRKIKKIKKGTIHTISKKKNNTNPTHKIICLHIPCTTPLLTIPHTSIHLCICPQWTICPATPCIHIIYHPHICTQANLTPTPTATWCNICHLLTFQCLHLETCLLLQWCIHITKCKTLTCIIKALCLKCLQCTLLLPTKWCLTGQYKMVISPKCQCIHRCQCPIINCVLLLTMENTQDRC